MAKPQPAKKGTQTKTSAPFTSIALIQAVAEIFSKLVEQFGWPGASLIMIWVSIQIWATDGQKQQIIDLYILGSGFGLQWPSFVLAGLFVLVIFAQRRFYLRKIAELNDELAREGREKSALQAKLAGGDLQHAQSRTPGGH